VRNSGSRPGTAVPALPGDRRKLGDFMRAHPGQSADPVDARIVRQAGQALLELADAMDGKPVTTQEPLGGPARSGGRG